MGADPAARFDGLVAARVREELAAALRDTACLLPGLSPLESAQAERVYACMRAAELAVDHDDVAADRARLRALARCLAALALEALDAPDDARPALLAELRAVARNTLTTTEDT